MPNATQILRNGSRLTRTRDALLAGGEPGAWDEPGAVGEPEDDDTAQDADERAAPAAGLRAEIAASWQRSLAHGVRRDRFSVPFAAPQPSADRLRLAAAPIADAVGTDLAGTGVSLLVSDHEACILDRRVPDASLRAALDRIYLAPGFRYGEQAVGTTAISVALSQRRPAIVASGEHYADTLTEMVCAAAPVIDPLAGDLLGTIGLACRAEEASTLMIALVKRAARDIEQRIASGLTTHPRPGARWDSLTAAERDVAAVIAEGATNREAAARLYVSPHTIDYHLRQIFRKMGVASRVELTRLMTLAGHRLPERPIGAAEKTGERRAVRGARPRGCPPRPRGAARPGPPPPPAAVPPQTPSSWSVASAHSRQAARTGHCAHTRFARSACASASRVVPTGKNSLASACRHAA